MGEPQEGVEGRIKQLRDEIDDIDRRLVGLLNQRAKLALDIRELKPQVNRALYDPRREQEIFESLRAANGGPLFDDNLRSIWEVVLQVMKEL